MAANLQFRQIVNTVPPRAVVRENRTTEADRKPERFSSDLGYDFGAIFHDIEDREENGTL